MTGNTHKEKGVIFPILIGGRISVKKVFVNLYTRRVKKAIMQPR